MIAFTLRSFLFVTACFQTQIELTGNYNFDVIGSESLRELLEDKSKLIIHRTPPPKGFLKMSNLSFESDTPVCNVCLEADGAILLGCACRGFAGVRSEGLSEAALFPSPLCH